MQNYLEKRLKKRQKCIKKAFDCFLKSIKKKKYQNVQKVVVINDDQKKQNRSCHFTKINRNTVKSQESINRIKLT